MLTLIIPPQVTAASRTLFFSNFDIFGIIKLFNNGQAIAIRGPGKDYIFYIMAATGQGIRAALFIFLFRQFFRGVPIELEESAQIDGAGILRTFWSVMLPNARGVITTVALFAFVWQWNDVYYTTMFAVNSSDFPLLTMQIINTAEWLGNLLLRSELRYLVSADVRGSSMFTSLIANTEAFLMMLPLLIAYLFVQKLFVEGIERTGIVG
jgi:multiple sugar transport system permease protein